MRFQFWVRANELKFGDITEKAKVKSEDLILNFLLLPFYLKDFLPLKFSICDITAWDGNIFDGAELNLIDIVVGTSQNMPSAI